MQTYAMKLRWQLVDYLKPASLIGIEKEYDSTYEDLMTNYQI